MKQLYYINKVNIKDVQTMFEDEINVLSIDDVFAQVYLTNGQKEDLEAIGIFPTK